MQRQWEKCTTYGKQARWSGFHVTMTPRGEIYMNGNTLKALDAGERFVLLYDRLNKIIGVKPVNSLEKDSQGSKKKGSHTGRSIRGYGFMQQFGISIDRTVRFLKPEIDEDGILLLDLKLTTNILRKRPG